MATQLKIGAACPPKRGSRLTSLVVAAGSSASPAHAPHKNVPCRDEDAAVPANGKIRQQVVAQEAQQSGCTYGFVMIHPACAPRAMQAQWTPVTQTCGEPRGM